MAEVSLLLPTVCAAPATEPDRAMLLVRQRHGQHPRLDTLTHDPRSLCSESLCLEEAASPRPEALI